MALHTLDRRTRRDSQLRPIAPAEFFADVLPGLAARHGALVARGMAVLGARPLAVEVDGASWSLVAGGDELAARPGAVDGAVLVGLTREQFSDVVQQERSLNGLMVSGEIPRDEATARDLSIWDSLWMTLLEGWPVVGDVALQDRSGSPLDLARAFTPTDDPADVAHFLREAGYLHLRGWVDPALMPAIEAEIDAAVPHYRDGDGRSWWAVVDGGDLRCVRIQDFLEHSPTTAALLHSESWDRVRRTVAGEDDLVQAPVEGRCIEALIKPVGVTAGPSDMSFHRDCHLGRHAYSCCGLTVGISVTSSGAGNGQLQVVAGSHRVAMPVEVARTDPYLPVVGLPTEQGDLTVHLSCTLHESTPPRSSERKVMYTGFGLPALPGPRTGGRALTELRERVHQLARPSGPA